MMSLYTHLKILQHMETIHWNVLEQACKMIQQLNTSIAKPLVDYAFDILAKVAQGNFTKWSIVYDITNKTIQFRTNRFKEIKTMSFSCVRF